ncbi:MAG: YbaK/EbsC family protein [Desulfurococcales archaeon]|nr:YbaK/EbsC family protein [Desulfurococcales archaeon]
MGRDRVMEWIRDNGLGWRLHTFKHKVKTVEQAARLLNTTPDNIAKTIILIVEGKVYAAILRGDTRLDIGKMAGLLGVNKSSIRIAKPEEVEEKTGYNVGGVPPVPLPRHVKIVVDRKVLEKERLYAGGGDQYTLMELDPRELVEKIDVVIADIS